MTKRITKINRIIQSTSNKEDRSELDSIIGHPCGAMCSAIWLAFKPQSYTDAVCSLLVRDANGSYWNKWSFASMLSDLRGHKLNRKARKLVKWYTRKGMPRPWAEDRNRCFIQLEGEWMNCAYDDMPFLHAFYSNAGASVVYCYPRDALERLEILRLPVSKIESDMIPY